MLDHRTNIANKLHNHPNDKCKNITHTNCNCNSRDHHKQILDVLIRVIYAPCHLSQSALITDIHIFIYIYCLSRIFVCLYVNVYVCLNVWNMSIHIQSCCI